MVERRKSPVELSETEPHMCSVDVRLDILSRVPFFQGLESNQLQEINRRFVELGFLPGEIVYFEGEEASRLYVVAAGNVKLLRHAVSGKNVLLDMLTPGEFFGSLAAHAQGSYPDTAQAHTSACVLSIGADGFRKIMEDFPQVTLVVLDVLAERLSAAHEMVRQLSAYSVEKRIAHTLLKLGKKLGKARYQLGLLIDVPVSRSDLAEMTGTTTETASRIISQLEKDGLVESGRQWIAIKDREKLEEMVLGDGG